MKKKFIGVTCIALASAFAFASCALGGGGATSTDTSDPAGGSKKTIAAPLTLDGFNSTYAPASSMIEKKQGKIDVVLVFEDTLSGWEALAAEYERLHGGTVAVELNSTYTEANSYTQNLSNQVTNSDSDWDIVQGNLFHSGGLSNYCINMNTAVNDENAYAGSIDGEARIWKEVLTEDAYLTDKTGSNNSTYIMNSEGLQTAWFVNDVARQKAIDEGGYTGSKIPANWDELMDLCAAMEKVGYENPLGIALDKDSIGASQFTWLLRVYGDYYYRGDYQNIMLSKDYTYDPTAENPEADMEYGVSANKIFYSIFQHKDENYYVGPRSAKFQEFIEQFKKMKPYLRKSAAIAEESGLKALRSEFATQPEGKNPPQILLDYAGAGLNFIKNENDKFKVDFFDYPVMVSEGNYIPKGTLLRDVGGNGGYLSIIKRNATQDALNLDFMKFVVSPYGQSIYYKALSEAGSVPMGMTTVVNDTVVIPETWKTFFKTDKISFTGLVDGNPYISFLIRGFNDSEATNAAVITNWQRYLTGEGKDALDTVILNDNGDSFVSLWTNALESGWVDYCETYGYTDELRTNRDGNIGL